MSGTMTVLAAAAAFVGTHLAMSHALRRPLVDALGEKAFLGLYSLVAFATFGVTVWAYQAASVTAPLWGVGDPLWTVSSVLMLVASVLFMGSLVRNPALAGAAASAGTATASGVYAITRHPMMWAFALWGVSHILVHPVAKNIILSGAIIVLALVGAAMQDRKKAALDPTGWPLWVSRTSYLPFAAIIAGRTQFGRFGGHALGGGVAIWLGATWAHIPLAGLPAGIWRWIV